MRVFRNALIASLVFSASFAALPVLAQPKPSATDDRAVSQFWNVYRTLTSECGGAAWTLWQSNSYERWRSGKSPVLSMHYSARFYQTLPPAPQALPEPTRAQAAEAMKKANDILKTSAPEFSTLADYINAKDFKDDKYKKGDEINTRLVAAGKACFDVSQEMENIFTAYAEKRAPDLVSASSNKPAAQQRLSDWQMARDLSNELAKGTKADLAALDTKTKALSEMVEKRLADPALAASSFYRDLNKDVAVEMRKTVREIKEKPKLLQEYGEQRPRNRFVYLRSQINAGGGRNLLDEISK
ncbi:MULTISPECIES: DUF3829 domain-containing protein [unclassified Beijerinckia]|uniref:DUF3829 domain-containing protein n=1 Tax=unclassified Beijerinckia TaxID=2638183 RepID=UPI0008984DE7|nr:MULTISPECIES: DUF3829 domain-containing protein [unclassified Beijerinckia]MDH7797214.1 hypothetical protein [Beijerinckia sp. GAS462]SEC76586.1 Protein of unknown function [Beijerinckia sp. 28-YEA-48]